jgi:hypothetical protein
VEKGRQRVFRRTMKSLKTRHLPGYCIETPGPILIQIRLGKAHISAMLEFAIVAAVGWKNAGNVVDAEGGNH